MVMLPAYGVGNWYWKIYIESGLFDLNKEFKDYFVNDTFGHAAGDQVLKDIKTYLRSNSLEKMYE